MLVRRTHKDRNTILGKALNDDERRRRRQDLFLKFPHAGVSSCALGDTQQGGILGGEDFRSCTVDATVLRHVRQKFSSGAEQEKCPQSGQFLPRCAEKQPGGRLHCLTRISSPAP
jgi:hypothetical protein